MRLLRRFPVFVAVLVAVTMGLVRPAAAQLGALHSTMLGANEVPKAGDPNASGSTFVVMESTTGKVCYVITVSGISAPLTAGHIHVGAAGVAGPVVIPLPLTGGPNVFAGCTTAAKTLIKSILNNPSGYYTNVHNPQFPGGVIRGQLSNLVPSPVAR